ncbi:MAG: type II secretion system ATPase GspE [Bdellovibrionota bacterium]
MKNNPWDDDENPEATIAIDRDEVTKTRREKDSTVRADIKTNGSSASNIKQPSKEKIEDTFRGFSTKLGEILLTINPALSRDQINQVASMSGERTSSENIGDVLLKKKLITEDELVKALSMQSGIPLAKKLEGLDIDSELTDKISIGFAKKHLVLPYERQGNTVYVAISNPNDIAIIDDLRILLQSNIRATLAKKNDIMNGIHRAYEPTAAQGDPELHQDLMDDLDSQDLTSVDLNETQDLLDSDDEAPIIRLVNTLLFRAIKEKASDIHIEPAEKDITVRFRIDGILYEIMRPPKRAQASITSRVKIMAGIDIAERRIPQDGRIKTRLGGKNIDIRVSTLPTSYGERIVMRILDTASVVLDLEDLGFDEHQLALIKKITQLSHGIFLVTGPTGSGKTSTLYACLTSINTPDLNIITVENPVEIQLAGLGQIQVDEKVGLTFAEGLRSILRQDPDVIMVGEIRDKETAEIAIQASLTGHFVFSTIHTNDAASSITRLVDMGVEPFLISSSLVAAMAQRLVRRLCPVCKEAYMPTPQELKELNITPEKMKGKTIYKAKGCPSCAKTGYKGRMAIYEIMPVDDTIRSMILKNLDAGTIKKAASQNGLTTLREDGAKKFSMASLQSKKF